MSTSIARSLICATGLAVALGGCSTPAMPTAPATPSSQVSDRPDQGATTEQPPPIDTGVAPACTLIGNAEGVSVDLSDVLDLEGGDYFAQVSVPAQEASNIRGLAGNDEYYPGGDVAVDLDGDPVTVDVVVRDEDGQQVYTASGTATPELNQPNGAACDGENYSLSLLATTSGDLVPLERTSDGTRLDARGRDSLVLLTGCGVELVELDGVTFAREGGLLTAPAGGPPPGWNAPYQRGWATHDGEQIVYTDDAGHRETFRLDDTLAPPPPCG